MSRTPRGSFDPMCPARRRSPVRSATTPAAAGPPGAVGSPLSPTIAAARRSRIVIGTEGRAATVSPLLEDQGWGTVSFHIGRNDHVGGTNRATWWAWLFLRGANVTIDDRPVVQNGRLLP